MPLLRYFLVAGSGLLLLLFLVSANLPAPVTRESDANALDKTTIRINGNKPVVERVTIDTSVPTTTPSAAEPSVIAAQDSTREAFAKMEDASAPVAVPPIPVKKVAVRKRPKRSVVVTARPAGGLFDLW